MTKKKKKRRRDWGLQKTFGIDGRWGDGVDVDVPGCVAITARCFFSSVFSSMSASSLAAMARGVVLLKMSMVLRLSVILTILGARTSAFHAPVVSRSILPPSSNKMLINKMMQGSSCVASRGHRQRSCSKLQAKKKKKSALKGPASDALAQLELLEALEAEMEGVCWCLPPPQVKGRVWRRYSLSRL